MSRTEAKATDFDAPTENMTNIIPLLYQSGYLTIKDYDDFALLYTLDVPNYITPNTVTASKKTE